MNYYGTDLIQACHFMWSLDGDQLYRNVMRIENCPFNPEALPFREKGELISNGCVEYYRFCGFTICAIEGSCSDKRLGSKSIFFTKEKLTFSQLKDKIMSIPVAKKIIEKMPFEVRWGLIEE